MAEISSSKSAFIRENILNLKQEEEETSVREQKERATLNAVSNDRLVTH